MTIDVYSQYFSAEAECNGVRRRGALVFLQSDSEAGNITYTANVSFFPHSDDDDFSVSYDAVRTRVLYEGKGRRSKKREAALMESFRSVIDGLSAELCAKVLWDKPLREARLG